MTTSTWRPRDNSAASVRVAYSAPLAPVMAMATDAWRSLDIDGDGEDDQVEDADVAVQIERALDLRQIARTDQRLFIDQQERDGADADEIEQRQRRGPR